MNHPCVLSSFMSFLSCHFWFFLLSVFQLPVSLRDISLWMSSRTLLLLVVPRAVNISLQATHSPRVVMKDVPKSGLSAAPEASVRF